MPREKLELVYLPNRVVLSLFWQLMLRVLIMGLCFSLIQGVLTSVCGVSGMTAIYASGPVFCFLFFLAIRVLKWRFLIIDSLLNPGEELAFTPFQVAWLIPLSFCSLAAILSVSLSFVVVQ